EEITSEVKAWENHRNNKTAKINWQFTNDQARIKLKRLYPSILD
ncbi:MAG TPA: IS630 family transposase, partial [Flavobacteriaceae bacterium]